jgi:cytochrome c peroxidase
VKTISITIAAAAAGVILAAGPLTASDFRIVQKSKEFSSHEVRIKAGDQLTFVNADAITHNVYSATPGFEFDLRTQHPGQTSSVAFAKPGKLKVECAMHPKMRLDVEVTP